MPTLIDTATTAPPVAAAPLPCSKPTPVVTLLFGNVQFELVPTPNDDDGAAATFRQHGSSSAALLQLERFTGTLRVMMMSEASSQTTTTTAASPLPNPAATKGSTASATMTTTTSSSQQEGAVSEDDMMKVDDDEDDQSQAATAAVKKVTPKTNNKKTKKRVGKRQSKLSLPTRPKPKKTRLVDVAPQEPTNAAAPPPSPPETAMMLLGQDFGPTQLESQTQEGTIADMDDDPLVAISSEPSKFASAAELDKELAEPSKVAALLLQQDNSCSSPQMSPSSSSSSLSPLTQAMHEWMQEDDCNDNVQEDDRNDNVAAPPTASKPARVSFGANDDDANEAATSLDDSAMGNMRTDDGAAPVSEMIPVQTSATVLPKHDTVAPCARWGHTMTYIGEDKVLVYGGQTFDATTNLPQTLRDVYLYDVRTRSWSKPLLHCDSLPRQWHTSTYLPARQMLITWGGESIHPKTGKVKNTEQVFVFDTDIMLFYPPSVSGTVPSGRSGHTATLLTMGSHDTKNSGGGGERLVIFGGVKGSKWLNSVSVLDTASWKWSTIKPNGALPKPRSYHSATAIGGNKIVVFGGNDANTSFNSVAVLETPSPTSGDGEDGDDIWRWLHPTVLGYAPSPRTGHSAVLLADGKTICVYGGWDPNDDLATNDESMIFGDCHLLDTETWSWTRSDTPVAQHLAKKVGHEAVLLPGNDGRDMVIFGGRLPGDKFTDDLVRISVGPSNND